MNFGNPLWCRALFRMLVASTIFACVTVPASDNALPAALDLAAEAKAAGKSGMPLIVLVSLAGCPHCEVVRRSHLLPLIRDVTGGKPVVRQIEINGGEALNDFDGSRITHAAFARRYNVKLAPVVFFFNAKGQMLTEPLVGSMIPDFYGAYFDAAFNEAKAKLKNAKPED